MVRGWADRDLGRKITADDPVRIASISKLVVAIGLMRLVEQGLLDLDRDVSVYLGWPLRHPRYPDVPITLRQLLSHRTGLTDEAGYTSNTNTLTRELLSRPQAWDPRHAPGTFFRYSNVNFPPVAAAMERVTGERFDRLIARLVLRPLGIDGCFNWTTCSDAAISRAVVIYGAEGQVGVDDLRGRRPTCPAMAAPDGSCDLDVVHPGDNGGLFAPQGGLRISARDLAKIGRLLLNGGKVDRVRLISAKSLIEMLKPAWTFNGTNGLTFETDTGDAGGALYCRYGLATQTLATKLPGCKDDPWGDGVERVGHGGDAYGLVSGLWVDRAAGRGVAFFITGGDLNRRGTRSAFYAVEEELLAK
jgi:CubicO group peptidase (beta-lactamase class C family)